MFSDKDKMHEECGVFGVYAKNQVDTFLLMQFGRRTIVYVLTYPDAKIYRHAGLSRTI